MPMTRLLPLLLLALLHGSLTGCSMGQMVARSSVSILDGGELAMNRETDLELARQAMPANIKLLEGLVLEEPGNADLRIYLAKALYGYSFGFVEPESTRRAAALYQRCVDNMKPALSQRGIAPDQLGLPGSKALDNTRKADVPLLFWSGACWGGLINVSRDDPFLLATMPASVALMQRSLELDETYFNAAPHLFFAVYYSSRPAMLGGNPDQGARHFARAREITAGKLLMVDVLEAEFLFRQQLDQQRWHDSLTRVVKTPVVAGSDLALSNAMARDRAARLLATEGLLGW